MQLLNDLIGEYGTLAKNKGIELEGVLSELRRQIVVSKALERFELKIDERRANKLKNNAITIKLDLRYYREVEQALINLRDDIQSDPALGQEIQATLDQAAL